MWVWLNLRNRHFRILWSSKGGKSAVLKHTGRFSSEQTGNPLKFHFLESLVCNVAATDQLLTVRSESPLHSHQPCG